MEQSIFTYCVRRYDEAGSGWGFYSYSAGMKDYFACDSRIKEYAGSNGYAIPQNQDVWLTSARAGNEKELKREDAAIKKYHPEKFAYTYYDNGSSVFTYGKNLGRETVNEERTDNKLVYTIAGKTNEVKMYPCFYYDNELFRKLTRSFFKKSGQRDSNPEMPSTKLTPGIAVTYESIRKFISERTEREVILIKLFYALVKERSGRRRPILICDRNENIIFWIAAVTMLFPVDIAKTISFTTYDFLGTSVGNTVIPENFQLCGVYSPTINSAPETDATNYNISALDHDDRAVLFDLECGFIPNVETDSFEKVILAFCRGKIDKLSEYHKYIMNYTKCRDFGNVYTMLYPFSKVKEELFEYYSPALQKGIIEKYYPVLFDINARESDVEKASGMIECALNNNLLTREKLHDDVDRFVFELLADPQSDMNRVRQVEHTAGLIGLDAGQMLEEMFRHDTEKWVRQFTGSPKTNAGKFAYMLSMMDPFDDNDKPYVKRICDWVLEGYADENIAVRYIEKHMDAHFDTDSPKLQPQMFTILIELSGVNKAVVNHGMDLFFRWNSIYQSKAISAFDDTLISEYLYDGMMTKLWKSGKTDFNTALRITDTLWREESRYYTVSYDALIKSLYHADVNTRKRILEKLSVTGCCRAHDDLTAVIDSVYEKYEFGTPKELAEFSYALLCRLYNSAGTEYPAKMIKKAAHKMECTKRAWKKALGDIKPDDLQKKCDAAVRKILTEEVI